MQWILCGHQRIILSGDWRRLISIKRAIVFGNHQSYMDWWYIAILAHYTRNTSNVVFLLREVFSYIPVAGLCSHLVGFIFLRQDWATDAPRLERGLRGIPARSADPVWLVLFPEGGFPHPVNYAKARTYIAKAEAAGGGTLYVPRMPEYVVLPRNKGIRGCIDNLNPGIRDGAAASEATPLLESTGGNVDTLVDLTIGFLPSPRFRETGLYPGDAFNPFKVLCIGGSKVLSTVCIDTRIVPSHLSEAVIRSNEQQFDVWLKKLWEGKDNLMKHFEQNGTFEKYACNEYATSGLGIEEGVEGSGFVVSQQETVEFYVTPKWVDVFNVLFATVAVWGMILLFITFL
ncbi:hypothetical protein BC830DRAFT_685493 [Chytriomyces sp. MP71]|nr:hypothetical protein BC830DRAFT_685493 [Chytriomyces sp. MP71]